MALVTSQRNVYSISDSDALFGTQEATLACEAMGEQNDLMLSGDIVYKI